MKRFSSIRNSVNKKKVHDDNYKKIIIFTCQNRTEHSSLLEKNFKNSRAYFHFQKKALETRSDVLFKGNI